MKKILFLLSVMSCCFAGEEERIFFLHIPKSGGTTIRSILEDHHALEEKGVIGIKNRTKLQNIFDQYALIADHIQYFDVRNEAQAFKKMTFLRHPVKRVLSAQAYIQTRYDEATFFA